MSSPASRTTGGETRRGRTPREPRLRRVGELLVSLGYLLPAQLAEVLERQRQQSLSERRPIGQLCVEMGFLSPERLDLILERWGKRLRLGELLLNRNRINPAQLAEALERQRQSGGRLGDVLLELEFIDEVSLTETLAEQHDLAYVPLTEFRPQAELSRYVNALYAFRHGVVPIGRIGRQLTVAISDPTRREVAWDLERSAGLKIRVVLAVPSEVKSCLRQLYEFSPAGGDENLPGEPPDASLLRKVITRAVSLRATDLHLEPLDGGGRARVRLDGILNELTEVGPLKERIPGLVRALKTLAHLDVAETKRPQEGNAALQTDEGDFSRAVSLRVSTFPGPYGEGVLVRILDRRRGLLSLSDVGLSDSIRARLESLLRSARGVLLIAGPAGSGKRSTLRAALDIVRRPDALILTAEDPILFVHEGVSQAQIDPRMEITYASLLRGFIRQDPDAILLDSIADRETAEIAFAGGTDGPLILGTVRASNATEAVGQLLDLGVDANMVSSSLVGVLAQRLVRRNCPSCLQVYERERSVLEQWFRGSPASPSGQRGGGCESCNGTGFAGRIAVAELWIPSVEERLWISQRTDRQTLREHVLRRVRCLGQDALEHALGGRTTLEEALKVVPYADVVFTRLHGLEKEKEIADKVAEKSAA